MQQTRATIRAVAAVAAAGFVVAYAAGCERGRGRADGEGAARTAGALEAEVPGNVPGGPPGPPGPALPPCNVQNDLQGVLASSPAPGVVNVNQAMSQWVTTRCGPGFMATPRDVTCSFRSKVIEPKAGAIEVVPSDWVVPKNGEYRRSLGSSLEYFDATGKSLGKEVFGPNPPPTETHRGHFHCFLGCTGKLSATIATAEVIGGSAPGVPPGYIPPQFDAPPGKSFCDEYQKQLGLNGADCDVVNAQNQWGIHLTEGAPLKTPWKKTDQTGSTQEESNCSSSDKKDYPGCAKVVTKYDYEVWTLDPSEMQKACDDLLTSKAPTQADKDQVCGSVDRNAFRSVVLAAICIAQPEGEGEINDNE